MQLRTFFQLWMSGCVKPYDFSGTAKGTTLGYKIASVAQVHKRRSVFHYFVV